MAMRQSDLTDLNRTFLASHGTPAPGKDLSTQLYELANKGDEAGLALLLEGILDPEERIIASSGAFEIARAKEDLVAYEMLNIVTPKAFPVDLSPEVQIRHDQLTREHP